MILFHPASHQLKRTACRYNVILFFTVICLFSVLCFAPCQAAAATGLEQTIETFKKFGAESDAEVLKTLRRNNDIINRMAHSGKLSDQTYQAIQQDFAEFNKSIADEAAHYAGCKNTSQLSNKAFSPRTDSDYILSNLDPDKPMSSKLIKKALERYNQLMNERLGTREVNYAKKLDTDLMANPEGVTPEEFEKIAQLNNDAYARPEAASAEAKKRIYEKRLKEYRESGSIGEPPEPPSLTPKEIEAYQDEMNDFINKKTDKIKKLKKRFRKSSKLTPEELEELKSDLTLAQQQQAKYRSRIKQMNILEKGGGDIGATGESSLTEEAADRSITKQGMSEAEAVGKNRARATVSSGLNEHLTTQANTESALNKAGKALGKTGPARKKFIKKAAKIAAQLPPDQQGKFLEKIRKMGDQQLPREVAAEMRAIDRNIKETVQQAAKEIQGYSAAERSRFLGKMEKKYGSRIARQVQSELNGLEAGAKGAKKAMGKAMKILGEAMIVTQVFGFSQDIVDYTQGKISADELVDKAIAISTLGLVPLGQEVLKEKEESDRERSEIEKLIKDAQRQEDEARALQIAKELLKHHVGKREVKQIVDDILAGNEEKLSAKLQELAQHRILLNIPPRRIVLPPDMFWGPKWERLKSMAVTTGTIVVQMPRAMWDETKKAGKFVYHGGAAIVVMAWGTLSEPGVVKELVRQQSEHIADWADARKWEHYQEQYKDALAQATLTHQDYGMYRRLRKLGASSDEARKIIKLIRGSTFDDKKKANRLIKQLKEKKQRKNQKIASSSTQTSPVPSEKQRSTTKKDTTKTDNDTFGKLADAAAEKFNNNSSQQQYTNPIGCPSVIVQEVTPAKTGKKTGNEFVPFHESEISKPTIEIENNEGTTAPCATNDTDCLEAERLGIVREPMIPTPQEGQPPVSQGKESPAVQETEHQQPSPAFHVQLVPLPNKAVYQPGDNIKVLACIDNVAQDNLPLNFSWQGVDRETDTTAAVALDSPGSHAVSVHVRGKDGITGQASLALNVGKVSVTLTEYPSRPVVMGVPVSLTAKVQINGKPVKKSSFFYHWQPHEDVSFSPGEGTIGKTTARFPVPGTYRVWVDVYQPTQPGSSSKRLAQSQQVTITVQGIKARLSASPSSPLVGQKVTIQAHLQPKVSAKLVRFIWDADGKIKSGRPSANGLSYTYIPVDDKPATIKLKVLAQEGELQELDDQSISVTSRKYKVSVSTPKRLAPAPWKWDPVKGTAVELPQETATFQDSEVHCSLNPKPEGSPRYRWTVSPEGCSLSSPFSSFTHLNAHEKGTYQVTVTVTDARGIVLGTGGTTFTVTVSKRDMEVAEQKAKARAKADKLFKQGRALWKKGNLKQAITTVSQATRLAPGAKKIAKTLQVMQKQKKNEDKKIQLALDLIRREKVRQAEQMLSQAATISDTYPAYLDARQQMIRARKKAEQKKRNLEQAQKLIQQAHTAWQAKKWDQAVSLAGQAARIAPASAEARRLLADLRQKRQVQLEKRQNLIRDGTKAENERRLQQALTLLEKAQAIQADKPLSRQIAKIREKLQQRQKEEKQVSSLLKEAKESAAQEDFVRAIQLISKALAIRPDHAEAQKLQHDWQKQRKRQQENKKFTGLVRKGELAEQRDKLSQAITLYKQALSIHADKDVSGRIMRLQKKLDKRAAEQRRQQEQEKKFQEFLARGYDSEQHNKLNEAIRCYRQALGIHEDAKVAARIQKLAASLQKQEKHKQSRFNDLIAQGYGHEQKHQLREAIDAYQQALTIKTDTQVADHIRDLENMLQQEKRDAVKREKAQQNRFSQFITQGYQHEQHHELKQAIASYRKALDIRRDKKIASHIDDLQKTLRKQQIEQVRRTTHERRQQQVLRQHGINRTAQTRKTQKTPTPWTGRYKGTMNDNDSEYPSTSSSLTMILSLHQSGNRVDGKGAMRMQAYQADDTATFSVHGNCRGRTAKLTMTGDEGARSMTFHLSSDGRHITWNMEGEQIILKRIR